MEPILFSVTMEIQEGKLDLFKAAAQKSVAFLKENGPQIMVGIFIDEKNLLARSLQLHRDSQSILDAWQINDANIRDVMQHITTKRVDIFGRPNEAVMEGMRRLSGSGAVLEVLPRLAGFERF